VLSALGCTGDEDRLVDCPLAVEVDYEESNTEYPSADECTSVGLVVGPSFAAVACGFGAEAGAASYIHTSSLVPSYQTAS